MRMVRSLMVGFIACGLMSSVGINAQQQEPPLSKDIALGKARGATQILGKNLKSALQAAIKSGGLAHGVEICNLDAPGIADAAADAAGFEVGRTSLKVRNPNNAPDSWEAAELAALESALADGADPATIESIARVEGANPGWRYLRPIMTDGVCLGCHGDSIDPSVEAVIAARYPNDLATGFKLGDMHGAFTVFIPDQQN